MVRWFVDQTGFNCSENEGIDMAKKEVGYLDRPKGALPKRTCAFTLAVLISIFAGWIVLPSAGPRTRLAALGHTSPAIGGPQFLSIQPLPENDGSMCQWLPASFTPAATIPLAE